MNNEDGVRIRVQSHLHQSYAACLLSIQQLFSTDTINAWKTESHIMPVRLCHKQIFFFNVVYNQLKRRPSIDKNQKQLLARQPNR